MYNKKTIIDALRNLGNPTVPKKTAASEFEMGQEDDNWISAQNGVETPIYKKVKVAPSSIEGKGLFADEPIRKGDVIGVSHIRKEFERGGETYTAPFPSTVLGYYNHSEEPNVKEQDKGSHILMVAQKDIQPGEEITSDYTQHNIGDLETPDNFKKGGAKRPKLPKNKNSRAYSRSLQATNRLFAEHPLFEKPKSRKNKIYDPLSKYYADGGVTYGGLPPLYQQALQNFVYPNIEADPERTGHNALNSTISYDPNSEIENVNNPWWMEHELFHELQNQAGGLSTYGAVGQRPNPYVASDDSIQGYYNRRNYDVERTIDNMISQDPSLQFIPRHKLAEGSGPGFIGAEALQYSDPTTLEGEARDRERKFQEDGKSIFPQKRNGGPYNTDGPIAQEETMEDYPVDSLPKIYGHEPEDYQRFLDYNQTAPENRRGYEEYRYGDPNSYDHYGMWDALGKPKDFQEALQMNPDWVPDEYDGMYHGFSVNPNTGVFLKSGKPGLKPGDTTWMEIAGHYLSPRADIDTPVFDPEIGKFKYVPKYKDGGYTVEELPEAQYGKTIEKGHIYTFKDRPGSYYRLGEDNQIQIRNKDTGWKYVPMEDPKGTRRKALEQGLASGSTNIYTKPKPYKQNDTLEQKVDYFLGRPQDKAWEATMAHGGKDNLRHPMAGYYTANKLLPMGPAGIIAANALGIGHEAKVFLDDPRPWSVKLRESGEDIFNNFLGTVLSPLPEDAALSAVKFLSHHNLIPDGINDPTGANDYTRRKKEGGSAALSQAQTEPESIEIKLTPEEITEYAKRGYIIEDISVPKLTKASLGKIVKPVKIIREKENVKPFTEYLPSTFKPKDMTAPTLGDVQFRPAEIVTWDHKNKDWNLYNVDLPDRIVPGRSFEDVQHKLKNLRQDLGINSIEHLMNLYIPGSASPIGMARDSGIQIDPSTGKLFDSNTRYWLNRQYGFTPSIGEMIDQRYGTIAKDYGTLVDKSKVRWPDKDLGINYLDLNTYQGLGPGLEMVPKRTSLLDKFMQYESPGGPLMIGMGLMGGKDYPHEIKNVDYYSQLLNTYDKAKMSYDSRKYYMDLISSIKNQNGKATELQYNALQRLKTGNFDFGKKSYALGGTPGEEDCPEGFTYDAELGCIATAPENMTEVQKWITDWYANRKIQFPENDPKYTQNMQKVLPQYNTESLMNKQSNAFPVYKDFPSAVEDTPGGFGAAGQYDTTGDVPVVWFNPNLDDEKKQDVETHELTNHKMRPIADVINPINDWLVSKNVIEKDKTWPKEKKEFYDYMLDSDEQNIQSYLNVARRQFGLKPDEVVTKERLDQMRTEAESQGMFDQSSPNFNPDIYLLFHTTKTPEGLLEWFNLIANNDAPKANDETQYAKMGGESDYQLGDEVDKATMEKLKKLGYTFQIQK